MKYLNKKSAAVVVGLVALASALTLVWLKPADHRAQDRVHQQMRAFMAASQGLYDKTGEMPTADLRKSVVRLREAKQVDEGALDMLFEGRDPWGNKFVYEANQDPVEFGVILRSVGPNGLDEGGAGDDVQETAAIPYREAPGGKR